MVVASKKEDNNKKDNNITYYAGPFAIQKPEMIIKTKPSTSEVLPDNTSSNQGNGQPEKLIKNRSKNIRVKMGQILFSTHS